MGEADPVHGRHRGLDAGGGQGDRDGRDANDPPMTQAHGDGQHDGEVRGDIHRGIQERPRGVQPRQLELRRAEQLQAIDQARRDQYHEGRRAKAPRNRHGATLAPRELLPPAPSRPKHIPR